MRLKVLQKLVRQLGANGLCIPMGITRASQLMSVTGWVKEERSLKQAQSSEAMACLENDWIEYNGMANSYSLH